MSRHLRIMSVLCSATMFIMVSSSTYAKCVFSFDERPSDTSEVHLGYVTEDQVDYEVSIRDLLRRFDDSTYPKVGSAAPFSSTSMVMPKTAQFVVISGK